MRRRSQRIGGRGRGFSPAQQWAAIGSRGLFMLQYWSAPGGKPLAAWLGGKTIVDGLLGAVLGVETAKRLLHWPASI